MIISGVAFIKLILDNRKVNETLAWTIVLFFIPYFGVIAFILFGFNYKKGRLITQDFQNIPDKKNFQKLEIQKLRKCMYLIIMNGKIMTQRY